MSDTNAVQLMLDAAKLHPDDVAVQAIVGMLERTVKEAHAKQVDHAAGLAGYRRGTQGDPGYGVMHNIEGSSITSMMSELSALHAVAIVVDVLGAALSALGTTVDY